MKENSFTAIFSIQIHYLIARILALLSEQISRLIVLCSSTFILLKPCTNGI